VVLADRVIAQSDDWQVYTNGRVAGFLSWVHGDPPPVAAQGISLSGGGWSAPPEPQTNDSPGTV